MTLDLSSSVGDLPSSGYISSVLTGHRTFPPTRKLNRSQENAVIRSRTSREDGLLFSLSLNSHCFLSATSQTDDERERLRLKASVGGHTRRGVQRQKKEPQRTHHQTLISKYVCVAQTFPLDTPHTAWHVHVGSLDL